MKLNRPIATVVILAVAALSLAEVAYADSNCSVPPPQSAVRTIEPIVTTDWLVQNQGSEGLVILDIRPAQAYAEAHIPGAVSEPFVVPESAWITLGGELLLELPPDEELFESIGALGIRAESQVVIVTAPNAGEPAAYGFANATRVADTLLYAGLRQVAILDGGFPKWALEGLPVSVDEPVVQAVEFEGDVDQTMFVSREYVYERLGKVPMIDNRDADVYFGVVVEPFAEQAGHIPGASSLPTPWIWNSDGTYLDTEVLRSMARGVIQQRRSKEVIVYCGVGGYSSAWWFLLTQVLGYRNVKFYDGAVQDWARHHDLRSHRWE